MRLLLVVLMSLVCVMSEGQTRIIITTDFSLAESDFRVYNDQGIEVVMTDMLVHSTNKISIYLEPGDVYTIRINKKNVMLYPVPDTKETLYANLYQTNINSGWVEAFRYKDYVEMGNLRAMQ